MRTARLAPFLRTRECREVVVSGPTGGIPKHPLVSVQLRPKIRLIPLYLATTPRAEITTKSAPQTRATAKTGILSLTASSSQKSMVSPFSHAKTRWEAGLPPDIGAIGRPLGGSVVTLLKKLNMPVISSGLNVCKWTLAAFGGLAVRTSDCGGSGTPA